jgi:hypothetical protein
MWCCKAKVLVLLAALVAAGFHSPGAHGGPHGPGMLAAGGHEKGGAYAVCTACHWIPHTDARSGQSLRNSQRQSRPSPYAVQGNVSLMCLSCHDGAMAQTPPTSREWFKGVSTIGLPAADSIRGRDFGHHPYSVSYPVAGDLFLLPLGTGEACRLPLFSDVPGELNTRVECATCHDIHTHGSGASLRVPMENFELCLCCHPRMPELSTQVHLGMQKGKHVIDNVECTACHDK